MKKKGSFMQDNMGAIIMTAVAIGIGIWFVFAYLLHGPGDTVAVFQKCGALTTNRGTCKAQCDSTTEDGLADVGCKKPNNICCIPRYQNINDVVLPAQYGGGTGGDLDFGIDYIGLTTIPSTCKADPTDYNIKCLAGQEIVLPVKIGVLNAGKTPITVHTAPVRVIDDDASSVKQDPAYIGADKSMAAGPSSIEITTNIVISKDDAKLDYYWKIYPYAECLTDACKKSDDPLHRGAMRGSSNKFMQVKFVSSLS
jgi:hypothetical protein